MNNKHARTFLKFYKKVVLSTTFIFSLGLLLSFSLLFLVSNRKDFYLRAYF